MMSHETIHETNGLHRPYYWCFDARRDDRPCHCVERTTTVFPLFRCDRRSLFRCDRRNLFHFDRRSPFRFGRKSLFHFDRRKGCRPCLGNWRIVVLDRDDFPGSCAPRGGDFRSCPWWGLTTGTFSILLETCDWLVPFLLVVDSVAIVPCDQYWWIAPGVDCYWRPTWKRPKHHPRLPF